MALSVFDRYRHTVVSTDFIKTPRRAEDFALKCPELVVVDEAHGCTLTSGVGRGRQQRHELLRRVTADPDRHVLLVTATPHSGNEAAFRSLLHLLREDFADLPEDLDRVEREGVRRRLARHLIQRRRADIRHYLDTDTAFPARKDKEARYRFSPAYRKLFDDIFSFAREYATDTDGTQRWTTRTLLVRARTAALCFVEPGRRRRNPAQPGRRRRSRRRRRRRGGPPYRSRSGRR